MTLSKPGSFSRIVPNNSHTVIYAVGFQNAGLYNSINNGETWVLKTTSTAFIVGVATNANGNNVVICDADSNILLSTDYGENWTVNTNNLGLGSGSIVSVIMDSVQTIYIVTRPYLIDFFGSTSGTSTIYKSADFGISWSEISNNTLGSDIYSGGICNFDGTILYLYSENSFYRSLDSGASFTKQVFSMNSLTCNIDGQLVYFCTNDGKVYKSTDSGANFTYVTVSTKLDVIKCNSAGNIVVAVNNTSGYIYISYDYGSTFNVCYESPSGYSWLDFLVGSSALTMAVLSLYDKSSNGDGIYLSSPVLTPPPTTPPTTTYRNQNFYLTEEFDVSANNITAAVFDAEDTTDVSGNYPNKAEIRVEKSVIQNMFQYWTDAIDMSNAVVSDIFYRVNYTDSAVPLSPDFVVGAIMTASDPNMNPDSNLTNYLPQDYLRYLAKKLFNTTRGVDLFANETEVLQSVNTRCRVGLNQILLTYLDASANGIIRDEDDFIILDPYDPVEVAGSQKVTGNPSKKIMKQILQNDPARFVDISSNYAVAGETYWYKMPIEVGDNLYFPVTIKAPTDQQKLTQPDSTTLIEDRTYLIRCVVVANGSIPSPYNVYSYSALPSLTTFYH
jgi:photosystem II stability/assembly factor-like uncharacterized protein